MDLDRQENTKRKMTMGRIAALMGCALSLFLGVSVFFSLPPWLAAFFRGLLGYGAYLLPLYSLLLCVGILTKRQSTKKCLMTVLIFALCSFAVISAIYRTPSEFSWYESGQFLNSGGYLGELFAFLLGLGMGDNVAIMMVFLIAITTFMIQLDKRFVVETEEKKARNILAKLSDYNELGKRKIREQKLYRESATEKAAEGVRERSEHADYADIPPHEPMRKISHLPHATDAGSNSLQQDSAADRTQNLPVSARAAKNSEDCSVKKVREEKTPFSLRNIPPFGGKKKGRQISSEESRESSGQELAALPLSRKSESEARPIVPRSLETLSMNKLHADDRKSGRVSESETFNLGALQEPKKNERKKSAKSRNKQAYSVPPTQLLDVQTRAKANNKEFIQEVVEKLQKAFHNFGVDARVISYEEGPTITMFEVVLGVGVKISKLQNLSDDIALTLAVSTVRIAPIEGKSSVGIEVPNHETTSVTMREIIDAREFVSRRSPLNVVLGKDISGKPVVGDLTSMPHLLVAGATGSGKSVCVNAMILSILLNATPDEVRFIMIDPKQVELSNYNDVPHLLMPVVTDAKQAAIALNWAVQEMERRYSLMLDLRVKDYKSYNAKCSPQERIPYIVVIVDELADLMMVAAKQVEESICRIAQKARAAGIHLVVATQRPSVDVITGLIKANIPSRIAFSVSSRVDSGTILDSPGAEKLLGKGDMLYHPVSLARPKRVQGAFVSSGEIDNVVAFIQKQGYVTEQVDLSTVSGSYSESSSGGDDEYLQEAIALVRETGKASASMLQRRFSIGYNRAARLIDIMEEMGIIGPQQGSKPRDVL